MTENMQQKSLDQSQIGMQIEEKRTPVCKLVCKYVVAAVSGTAEQRISNFLMSRTTKYKSSYRFLCIKVNVKFI